MYRPVEANIGEFDPYWEQVLTGAVFVGNRPSFIDSTSHGEFDQQKVSVLRIEHVRLPLFVFVCLPRLARTTEPVSVRYTSSVSEPVRLAVPFVSEGDLRYFNADFINERIFHTGISARQFTIDEQSTPWIGYPERRVAVPAPGLIDSSKVLAFVLTPDITQSFPCSHRRNASWQATNLAVLDRNPL
jgi:hypothetical protein